jgi:hypothetical protein
MCSMSSSLLTDVLHEQLAKNQQVHVHYVHVHVPASSKGLIFYTVLGRCTLLIR